MRLNKFLASRGIAARRKADELIVAGRVSVNGVLIRELGTKIDPTKDVVLVDKKPVPIETQSVVYKLYKPVGVISTMNDEQDRTSLKHLVPDYPRVFPVGRLDRSSEGLLIMTNDGGLALRLSHPRYRQLKTYRVWVQKPQSYVLGQLTEALRATRVIAGKRRVFETVNYCGVDTQGIVFEVSLREGIYHEVKRLVDRAGLTVVRLVRIQQGPLSLGSLQPGQLVEATSAEYEALRRLSE